jgi:hypothetical protein
MKSRVLFASFLGALAYSATLSAATLMEFVDSDGETGKMWVEGAKVRSHDEGGYVIMDWEARTAYMVNTAQGMAMDMSFMLAAKPGADNPKRSIDGVSVDKAGDGPTIAGYDTVHYTVSVDGELCEDIFVSKKAMRDIGSADFFDRMQSMGEDEDDEMDYGPSNPCDVADRAIDFTKLGFPMRTVNAESGEANEVTRIELDAALPEGGFEVPAGMQIIDMSQMMQMHQNAPTDD